MFSPFILVFACIALLLSTAHGFRAIPTRWTGTGVSSSSLKAVTEVGSAAALDAAVAAAGDALVVVDYSTTWCGPCKFVLPKYVELSDKFTNVIFLKCIGDASTEASALMKREGVRSVPAFHFWKNGAKLDVVNGARIEEVEAAVVANQ